MDAPPGLPLELWDQVIDYNHNSIGALKACALTCSSFLYSCRVHLFYDAVILKKLKSHGTEHRHHGRLYTAATLLAFFEECPHLIRFVKSIAIHGAVLRDVDPVELNRVFDHLPSLKEASVMGITTLNFGDYTTYNPFSRKLCLEAICVSSIRSLELSSVLFRDAYELNTLLHQCPNLEDFAWFQTQSFSWSARPKRPNLPFPKLKSLHLMTACSWNIEPFVVGGAPFDLSQLQELVIGVEDSDPGVSLSALHGLFHIIGHTLTKLRINSHMADWPFSSIPANGRYPLDFTELHALDVLHVTDISMPATPWMTSIAIPKTLTRLTLEIGCMDTGGGTPGTTIDLIPTGEHLAMYAAQLLSLRIIVHRVHGCSAHRCGGYTRHANTDQWLEQVIIRMPDVGGKMKVMERTVNPPFAGKRVQYYDRYLVEYGEPEQWKEKEPERLNL
ncbi:hypothetical protein CYLTODRAFT_490998 [Cylindrobasidium torrendii FP15055 ss-10]|uniref:F-box domain-containing protein n=1 Tax=Cylindrobasidium torrendii FP15055 ss-10 TaxID=1314674 RepID=A0A0D7B9Z0_9AGAR|nr:hypothetical protein CYLTODRAFT_490998 [Cylindrobasidium torrendii FP15055 ss-10]